MHKNVMKCNKTQSKWCINKHGASKIIDTFETYQFAGMITRVSSAYWITGKSIPKSGEKELSADHL
jgi:hypothetical protein